MANATEQDYIQVVTYIKRKHSLTPAYFYNYWQNAHAPKVAPWAKEHGIRRYQQIHVSGKMVPSAAAASAPNAISIGKLPRDLVEFDGVVLFLISDLKKFTNGFKDPYYLEVIEPDERKLIDKSGPGSGVIASFQGKMVPIVHVGKSVIE
ncbi:hypothetical protein CC78DRAFT_620392 [Lojkania enalia]|uniref:EthD domain-containing protein n=1 Tax=Lojkania enalia TaxID=147567 RepID=A0A9P4MZG4_9PLEO|nr:hypothetical protein CC78DRAFT_620392 [Didymosphaeria enalia]